MRAYEAHELCNLSPYKLLFSLQTRLSFFVFMKPLGCFIYIFLPQVHHSKNYFYVYLMDLVIIFNCKGHYNSIGT
jgi:hypothetical protein